MVPNVESFIRKLFVLIEDFYDEKVKHCFLYFKSIPDSNEFDSRVRDLVRRSERLTIIFQVIRNGFDQTNIPTVNSFGYRRLQLMDWIIAINCLVNVLRVTVFIINTNDNVAIYLGDSFFRSKGRLPFLAYVGGAFAIGFTFREWILYLEAKGKFEVLSIWKVDRDGFNLNNFCVNKDNRKMFRFSIYFVSLFFNSIMIAVPTFVAFAFFTPLLTNPWTYKIPELAFLGTIWTVSLIFTATYLLNSLLGFAWIILCVLTYHLFKLIDLLHLADLLLKKTDDTEKEMQSFFLLIIDRLNCFHLVATKLKYIFFWFACVFAVSGDVIIYLGLIVEVYSNLFANLFATVGIVSLPVTGLAGLAFGNFSTELDRLTIKLHQLTLKSKLPVKTMSKVWEIMDRVAGPYNGVKIGDFITLEKTFFVLFILENIAILMLFTVNIGPLIET